MQPAGHLVHWHILQHNNNKQEDNRGAGITLIPDKLKRLISSCLSVCEVVLAEFFPQQPVLGQGPQLRTHLAKADQVSSVRQMLHDIQLQASRQVSQCHARRCGLKDAGRKKVSKIASIFATFFLPKLFDNMRAFPVCVSSGCSPG